MTEPARRPIVPIADAEIDDPDTSLVEALRDSNHPERILRAQRMARRKLEVATDRLKRSSTPPSGMRAVKR